MILFSNMPIVALPTGLSNTNTGNLVADWMPLMTMLPCVPTLHLYYRNKRWPDLALFSLGFALASLYHICHMHEAGLQQSSLLGISGPVWRTFDILCAQWLLGRTFSHAIAASHWVTRVLANTVFPAVCVYYLWTATEALPMQHIMRTLLAVILASLVAKLALEGIHTLPKYCKKRGARAVGFLIMGFVAFPMPEVFPRHYWLFHSIWHVCLAAGYYELYALIEQDSHKGPTVQHVDMKSAAQTKTTQLSAMQKAASNSSLESTSELGTIRNRVAVQGRSVHGKAAVPDTVASLEGADSDASAGTDFEEEHALSQTGAPAVESHAPSTLAEERMLRPARNGWKWSKRSA